MLEPTPPPTLAELVGRLRERIAAEAQSLNPPTLHSLAGTFGRLSLFCSETARAKQAEIDRRSPQGTDRQWRDR
jgi:hypothetical protein